MRHFQAISALLVATMLTVLSGCSPVFVSKADVELTGEFRTDGSCDVKADGRPMFTADDSARTTFIPASRGNPALHGKALLQVFCAAAHPGASNAILMLTIAGPPGESAPLGSYSIVRGPFDQAPPMSMWGAYMDPAHFGRWTRGAGLGGFNGVMTIAGRTGAVEFTQLDSARVVGTLRITGVREWGAFP